MMRWDSENNFYFSAVYFYFFIFFIPTSSAVFCCCCWFCFYTYIAIGQWLDPLADPTRHFGIFIHLFPVAVARANLNFVLLYRKM